MLASQGLGCCSAACSSAAAFEWPGRQNPPTNALPSKLRVTGRARPAHLTGDGQAVREAICGAHSGEAYFSSGTGVARFSDAGGEAGLAVVPQTVKRKWQGWRSETRRLSTQLRSYGVAGLLAYGFLNTLYYLAAFLTGWLYFAKVPKGLGLSEALKQFAAVMSVTWAASQVTKVPRIALALFLAPVADGSLIFLQARLRLQTRRNALLVCVGLCLMVTAAIFGLVIAMWM